MQDKAYAALTPTGGTPPLSKEQKDGGEKQPVLECHNSMVKKNGPLGRLTGRHHARTYQTPGWPKVAHFTAFGDQATRG